jgi:uncharacterized protein (TIGR03000 family)
MTRHLLIYLVFFCNFNNCVFGALEVFVQDETDNAPSASAKVRISQERSPGIELGATLDEGETQKDGGPYRPKKKLPSGVPLIVTASKDHKRGFLSNIYNDDTNQKVEVRIGRSELGYFVPYNGSSGDCLVYRKIIHCVAETYEQCCADAQGHLHPKTCVAYRTVTEYVWVPMSCCDRYCPASCSQPQQDTTQQKNPVVSGDVQSAVGSAKITLSVPSDTTVFANNVPMKSTGERRVFIAANLKQGYSYSYVIRAQAVRDGKIVEYSQTVELQIGDQKQITIDFSEKTAP